MTPPSMKGAAGHAGGARIGVVIPFFQREGGILAHALRSVFAQDLPPGATLRVVVVDDASPAPVGPELVGLTADQRGAVAVVAQANGGPGAARNAGLDRLAHEDVDFIAFLDSDDAWLPGHPAEATAALRMGYDCYFCDTRLASGEDGGHTSTAVMAGAIAARTLFEPRLRGSSENHLLWIDLALAGTRGAISTAVNVERGVGVSVWRSALGFDTAKAADRMGDCLMFRRIASQRMSRPGPNLAHLRARHARPAVRSRHTPALPVRPASAQARGPRLGTPRAGRPARPTSPRAEAVASPRRR